MLGSVVGSVVGCVVGSVVGDGVTIGSGDAGGFVVVFFGVGLGVGRSGVDRGSTASRSPPRCSTRWTGAVRGDGAVSSAVDAGSVSGDGASASGDEESEDEGWKTGVICMVATPSMP